ncbi:venom metalloproteinase 3-like isoform X2 [Leptopilina boulardi]|nr:venom metalloproteinase 3-like isoform X2 [Leptopilina boulardi]XP_051159243.1 venom metalloproteinase 3-like isoform X2 [Leptopilina boulardi]XP_051159244.1 venom metalloproteinase 3-like isoform X2 [Leptopilina boulardi]XP_051159245.1 venom metalloproteinase 3-like isoform X2 [Leptopilina boulardi]XP_051159246.1 venom metalloproteinase 3-like isoform X2 [Leptopilina boulardi]XP_051159248.1 venom metalloproteinase 3-like isoform X2 [Leptopilina boulardi]XP_051159249.1 venom metalloprotein
MRKSNNISFFYNNQTESEVFQTVSENGESQFNSVINYDQVDNEPIDVSNLTTVYPEILVYVDKTLFRHFDYDIEKTVIYTLTLWNGVDLNYRELQNPSVRLNIAGIVLCQDQHSENDPFKVDSEKLDEFGKFMYNQDQFKLGKDYDIAVLLGANPFFIAGLAGLASVGTTCVNNTNEQKIDSTAIIWDNTGFSGISVASHELGHLLGAPHDGEKNDSTAKHCSVYDGYIMTYMHMDEKQYYFSTCSKKIMSNYLRSEGPKCIRNNPLVNEANEQMLRILPGKFMTIDEQCRKYGFLRAYDVNPDFCNDMRCKREKTGFRYSFIAALEGTPCYIGKYCLRGECVEVNFNTTENNNYLKELFPSLSQHPTFNKSATEQCIEYGLENVTEASFENCKVNCLYQKKGLPNYKVIEAHYGTLCSNGGIRNILIYNLEIFYLIDFKVSD